MKIAGPDLLCPKCSGTGVCEWLPETVIVPIFPPLDSYIQSCVVLDSFGRGVSLLGVSDLRVENNIFYNIKGHGLRVGKWIKIDVNVCIIK